jgi:hypothetical protein
MEQIEIGIGHWIWVLDGFGLDGKQTIKISVNYFIQDRLFFVLKYFSA